LILGYLLRVATDPDHVILFRAADVEKASDFVRSDEMREAMRWVSRERRS
jgi:hypothetical protein